MDLIIFILIFWAGCVCGVFVAACHYVARQKHEAQFFRVRCRDCGEIVCVRNCPVSNQDLNCPHKVRGR